MQKNYLALKKTHWQFFNSGSRYQFNPDKRAQKIDGSQSTLGEIHKKLVKELNRPDVFLLNNLGEEVV